MFLGPTSQSKCLGRYSGFQLPPPMISSSNQLLVRFVTDNNETGYGFKLVWDSLASSGGVCFNDTQSLLYEPSGYFGCPYGYGNYLHSTWIINVFNARAIELSFISISTEGSDIISVYDGFSSNAGLIANYSGVVFPQPIVSSSASLCVVFRTDEKNTANGFTASYRTLSDIHIMSCLISNTQELASYKGSFGCSEYGINIVEEWNLVATTDEIVALQFEHFDSEENHDFLFVFDGPDTSSPLLLIHSGKTVPQDLLSSTSDLTVQFVTDSNSNSLGSFVVHYEFITNTRVLQCDTDEDFNLNGVTGNFGCDGYSNSVHVSWLITVPIGYTVSLHFERFDTEAASDILRVYDGDSTSDRRLGSYSGRFSAPHFDSTSNLMFIVFDSDEAITGSGFVAVYSSVDTGIHNNVDYCAGSSDYSLYASQTGSLGCNRYAENIRVSWVLQAPPGNIVSFAFLSFQTETDRDVLYAYDGADESSLLLGAFSGNIIPPAFQSTSDAMFLKFQSSDSSLGLSGFYGRFHPVTRNDTAKIPMCAASENLVLDASLAQFGCGGYSNDLNSSWLIQEPLYSRISISFTYLDTEENYDCVSIYDGASAKDSLLLKVSGHVIPSSVTSSGNKLLIVFHSDASRTMGGFVLEYRSFLTYEDSCSSSGSYELSGHTGTFGCNTYANNVHITWLIQVKKRILLQFERFETEYSYDWLVVYDGNSNSSPIIGDFSGTDFQAIISSGASVLVEFSSDSSITAAGFVANYFSID